MQSTTYPFSHGDTQLETYVALPDQLAGRLPVVLVAHDWSGRNSFAEEKAERIAAQGYIGIAVDMYGKGKHGSTNDEKMALMQPLMDDRSIIRDRLLCTLEAVADLDHANMERIAIIGYCFGGLCALDLARAHPQLKAAVSVHGLLDKPENLPAQTINAKVLALHGYDDPLVPPEKLMAFADEMTTAKADWQIHAYGRTMHAFTNPEANDPELGTVYNPTADKRAWNTIDNFLYEIFSR